ncbi:unnamed protein product [Nippostrongylus brasiliensis]|uniref:AraC family transcriptional regulator n=1 Tax=Nippostrongylus brasiliensis TaxID=27835 RepID=A0A0N4YBG1_NIPBR|nr:hypothetical protein Q1695_000754 [Nippostrongylus brasiliensis]VDL77385.1 unnamed protein product [Nippostrongylus brasiliensis]
MSIAILNDPQLSNDIYDLLISHSAPTLFSSLPMVALVQRHDIITIEPDCYSEYQHSSTSVPLTLLLRLQH